MTTGLLDIILADTFIKSDSLKKVVVLRNHLVKKIFNTSIAPETADISEDPKMTIWVLNLNPALFSAITQANVYTTFDNLESTIKAIEPLMLYLPYELPEKEVTQIGNKLRDDYGPHFLMEINMDPNLIAGCAISFKGIYKDYSVKYRITEKKQAILSTFRQYVKH